MKSVIGALLVAAAALPAARAAVSIPAPAAAAADANEPARVLVKYRADSGLRQPALAGSRVLPLHAAALGQRLGLPLADRWVLGAHLQSLQARGIGAADLAARLRSQPEVEWAVPVGRKTISAATPNDPYYGPNQATITPTVGQWYLRAPDATIVSATNAIGAWALTTGSAAVTVAVLDTGVRFEHPDFRRADGSSKLHPGYDFISRTSTSADGNGFDADATDPGDGTSSSSPSSWHGTQTASIVGAASDNGVGMAGVGREVMVLPIRVLGKGGGYDDDIQAGMLWAAGLSSDPSLPANPHPARVLSMSLGSHSPCDSGYPEAFQRLVAAGVTVVVAAGNGVVRSGTTPAGGIAVGSPANCPGALAVAGVRHTGTKVGYSDLGPEVALAAPAGNCVTLSGACLYPIITATNTGSTGPGASTWTDSYDYAVGTSFAAPQVAGAVALMLSVAPTLSVESIRSALTTSARAFPAPAGVAACRAPSASSPQDECACTATTCGAGMLDIGAAVAQVLPPSSAPPAAVIGASSTSPAAGATVSLTAAGSVAYGGRSIVGYQWTLVDGAGFAAFSGPTNGVTATLATSAAGAVTVELTVTDTGGNSTRQTLAISVQAAGAPTTGGSSVSSGGGGGGGAVGFGWLAGLALAAAALSGRARRAPRSPAA